MQQPGAPGMRINSFRALTGIAETPAGRDTLKQLLSGKFVVPGVELRQLDRWNLIGRLVALNDSDAATIFAAEQQRDKSGDGQKYAWSVQAGAPTAEAKQQYFAQYLLSPTDPAAKPEDWLTQSLRPFNSWNQSALTEPYLRRALDQLSEIKRDRKIFYLGAWLGAFIGGQQSSTALTTVRQWLAQPGIDPDLRLKVLENADELERTVRIRQRFPN
jgi:aminopeptidase N